MSNKNVNKQKYSSKGNDNHVVLRSILLFLGLVTFVTSLINVEVFNPVIAIAEVLPIFFGLIYLIRKTTALLDISVLFVFIAAISAYAVFHVPSQTDEESLVLYSAYLFLHHQNPYIENLSEAYSMFPVQTRVVTTTLGQSL